jgi:hypothetical protein
MSAYSLYIDDSGHPDDRPYVVVAGFIAPDGNWLAFEAEWKDSLKNHGLGEVFHMADFMRQDRRPSDRGRILGDLRFIIQKHTACCFSCGVDMAAYRKVNDEYALEESLGAPYALAGRSLAVSLRIWKAAELPNDDRWLIFAESGSKHRGDMEQVFERDRLPHPQTVPKSMPAVQAADMLAWEIFQCLLEDGRPRRRNLRRLVEDNPKYHTRLRAKELINTCQSAKVPPRDTIPPNTRFRFYSNPKRLRRRTIR